MKKPETPTWQVELDGVGYCWNGKIWYEEKTRQHRFCGASMGQTANFHLFGMS